MMWSRWCGLVLGVSLLGAEAHSQVLHDVTANCEISNAVTFPCIPPIVDHRTSPSIFTTYADSAVANVFNCQDSAVLISEQITSILSDYIFIHQRVDSDLFANPTGPSVLAKSDAVIHFKIDPGHRYSYHVQGELDTANPGSGSASAWYKLSRQGPGAPRVVDTVRVDVTGPPTVNIGDIGRVGTDLDAGDYTLEAHTSASGLGFVNTTSAEAWVRLKLHDLPTAVESTAWGRVKALYK